MQYVELILSFIVGAAAAGLLGLIFSLKTKGLLRLLINIATGAVVLILLSIFKVPGFSLNPLSAFLVGILGVPGLIAIFIITTFL